MSLFTTFGIFSIAAGILLIFLIFVMLAAERRGELGIARAVGTRRGHLVQMFLFEGVAYDLVAAAVGALARRRGRVRDGARRWPRPSARRRLDDRASVKPAQPRHRLRDRRAADARRRRRSRPGASAGMNIVTAIRNLPEPADAGAPAPALGAAPSSASSLGGAAGRRGRRRRRTHVRSWLGVSLVHRSASCPSLRALGVPDRVAYTRRGLALVVWFAAADRARWLSRRPEDGLLDLHRRRADDRRRRDLGDHVQRRRSSSAARRGPSGASARPRARAAACRSPIRCGACSAPA